MGAWGTGYLDNDEAGDFVSELSDAADWAVARAALETVAEMGTDDYLELTEGSAAIAAAALFAQKSNKLTATSFPDDIAMLEALPAPPALAQLALKALARVRGANSELAELWKEAGDAEWISKLNELQAALQ